MNVIYISCLFVLLSLTSCEVRFIIQLSNEGVRTFKNTGIEYLDSISENQLTHNGIIQLITMGKHLRKHYIEKHNFLNRKFNRDEIKLYSIGKSVNIESLNYMMNGLYPHEKVFPIKHVNILPDKCLRLDRLEKTNKRKYYSIIDEFSKKYHTHFRTLPENYLLKYDNVVNLCDSSLSVKAQNSTFINGHLLNDCKHILNKTFYNVYNDKDTNDIRVSNLLDQIIRRIDINLKCFDECTKYINYSISTKDISAFLYFLDIHFKTMHHFPTFNTIVLIELEEVNYSTLIKIHFNDKHLITMEYKKFKEIIINNIISPSDVSNYCNSDDTIIFQMILLILIFSIVIVLGIFIYRMLLQLIPKDESAMILEHKSNDRSFTYEFSKNYLYKN
jgi:hypothetical protein